MHFADRLAAACRTRGNALCVGLDPRWEQLPLDFRESYDGASLESRAEAFEDFCIRVLNTVGGLVPIVKPQSAFFEACGPAGMAALKKVLAWARELGLVTILDNKRGDIASTAEAYAEAALGPESVWGSDSMTVNPYLGRDAVEPFLQCARRTEAGVFVLVRTSNKGAKLFQDLIAEGKPIYQHVGLEVARWASERLGDCGFGDVGAVVGATHPTELATLRQMLPEVIFLVPGYGAQGGASADIAAGFRADGLGAVVNSSRGITACFKPEETAWEDAIRAAAEAAIADLRTHTPMGNLG